MNQNIEIRKVKTGDAQTLAYIQTESWKSAFSGILSEEDLHRFTNINKAEEMYTTLLSKDIGNGSILLVNEEPHCMLYWDKTREEDEQDFAELICIHSLDRNWNKGYGSIMLQHALAEMKEARFNKVMLWVFKENIRACKFYEKHGFTLTNETKEFCNAIEVMYQIDLESR